MGRHHSIVQAVWQDVRHVDVLPGLLLLLTLLGRLRLVLVLLGLSLLCLLLGLLLGLLRLGQVRLVLILLGLSLLGLLLGLLPGLLLGLLRLVLLLLVLVLLALPWGGQAREGALYEVQRRQVLGRQRRPQVGSEGGATCNLNFGCRPPGHGEGGRQAAQ